MRIWNITAAALLVCAVGCNKSPEGGTTPNSSGSFTLTLPGTGGIAKDVKQGNTESFDASVDRKGDFKKDVKLSVSKHPEKVEVKLNKDHIKASEGDTKFTITVSPAKDAAIGEHEVEITGTPEGAGSPTTGRFKIKVVENK